MTRSPSLSGDTRSYCFVSTHASGTTRSMSCPYLRVGLKSAGSAIGPVASWEGGGAAFWPIGAGVPMPPSPPNAAFGAIAGFIGGGTAALGGGGTAGFIGGGTAAAGGDGAAGLGGGGTTAWGGTMPCGGMPGFGGGGTAAFGGGGTIALGGGGTTAFGGGGTMALGGGGTTAFGGGGTAALGGGGTAALNGGGTPAGGAAGFMGAALCPARLCGMNALVGAVCGAAGGPPEVSSSSNMAAAPKPKKPPCAAAFFLTGGAPRAGAGCVIASSIVWGITATFGRPSMTPSSTRAAPGEPSEFMVTTTSQRSW
mmetsp:Transcript_15271/g.36944  ORF Transcript_15271/g.36944 Transcript_15271/m.36944 type:complete len:311 (-) Transcript_15271:357-1289(-)